MLIAFNKPFNVLCQFTARSVPPRRTLAEFGLPPGVYAAGRLDHDSEGLLLLTDDGALAHRLTDPRHKQAKTYWVQVEGAPDEAKLDALRRGVLLNDGPTRPAQVALLETPCGVVAARSAGAPPQDGARPLARVDHQRGPQPPGAADDRRRWPADAAAGAGDDRQSRTGRSAAGAVARGRALTSSGRPRTATAAFCQIHRASTRRGRMRR